MKIFIFSFFLWSTLAASPLQLIKKGLPDANATLLVIGGIHGNEPGGYFAASILATHYKILSNALWIVPNLNQQSIQANKRGIHGDMNRKFAHISPKDPDYPYVEAIKQTILAPEVSLILNLHDGHGFYRKKNEGSIFNPKAWGQTCVIDQCHLNAHNKFADLDAIANSVKENINKKLIKKHHSFNVKNTNTKFDDEEMQNSLTYFAITHKKPALAIETSKNLRTLEEKVFYQLIAIEEFMRITGIKFKRDFPINLPSIRQLLHNHGKLRINDNIIINLSNIKKTLSFIPIKSEDNTFLFTHPLGSVRVTKSKTTLVFIGNKLVTTLKPQFFKDAKECPREFNVYENKHRKTYPAASEFFVKDDFKIEKQNGIRVNIIGYSSKFKNESGVVVKRSDLQKRYAIDRNNSTYRVEFYKDGRFCSMSLVHFEKGKKDNE